MIFGIISNIAGIAGMMGLGYILGPLAIVIGIIGLAVSFRQRGRPILVNILGIGYGVVACFLSPVIMNAGDKKMAAPAEAVAPLATMAIEEPPAREEPPASAAVEPAPTQPTPVEPAPIETAPAATVEDTLPVISFEPIKPVAMKRYMDADIIEVLLNLSGKVDPASQKKPLTIDIVNKSDLPQENIWLMVAFKDSSLWPANALASLTPFDTKTLPMNLQLHYHEVPFKDLYEIQIGLLPPKTKRQITLNLNAYDEDTFAGNFYIMKRDKGENMPIAWTILDIPKQ